MYACVKDCRLWGVGKRIEDRIQMKRATTGSSSGCDVIHTYALRPKKSRLQSHMPHHVSVSQATGSKDGICYSSVLADLLSATTASLQNMTHGEDNLSTKSHTFRVCSVDELSLDCPSGIYRLNAYCRSLSSLSASSSPESYVIILRRAFPLPFHLTHGLRNFMKDDTIVKKTVNHMNPKTFLKRKQCTFGAR